MKWRHLGPDDVNGWIKEAIGDQFSAKDFRTWNATVVAAMVLAEHADEVAKGASRKRIERLAIDTVAEHLNNTPAVCRASYVDPRIFDRFDAGQTIAGSLQRLERRSGSGEFVERGAIERAVIELLD